MREEDIFGWKNKVSKKEESEESEAISKENKYFCKETKQFW